MSGLTPTHQDLVKNLVLLATAMDYSTHNSLFNLRTDPPFFDVDNFVNVIFVDSVQSLLATSTLASSSTELQHALHPAPRPLNVGANCPPNVSCQVAFGPRVFWREPREVSDEIMKDENLSIAFQPGTYADRRNTD